MKKTISIGNRKIGGETPTFIIAEVGLNHNGDLTLAKKLIDQAKSAGADAVKFQSYHSEEFVGPNAKYYGLFKSLELSEDEFKDLAEYARKKEIIFLSTPLDLDYVEILNKIGVPAFKIASGDLTFVQLLEKTSITGKPIILSTGLSTVDEIIEAVSIIKQQGNSDIILLHCITCYPPDPEEVNLKSIQTLKEVFNEAIIGYSDHTLGILAPIIAVALGAKVIEKHFTLDKNLPGPDHKVSADPKDLTEMIKSIRQTEKMLGTGIKCPSLSEMKKIGLARRSIVARRDISIGETLTLDIVSFKRPADGLDPKFLDQILNRIFIKSVVMGQVIKTEDLSEE